MAQTKEYNLLDIANSTEYHDYRCHKGKTLVSKCLCVSKKQVGQGSFRALKHNAITTTEAEPREGNGSFDTLHFQINCLTILTSTL